MHGITRGSWPAHGHDGVSSRSRQGIRLRSYTFLGITWAAAWLSGCSPEIKKFVVQPQGYCSTTQKVHIAWNTSHGDTTIKIEPPNTAPRDVSSSGSLDVVPQPMTVTLTVDNGRRHEIRTINVRPVNTHPLNGLAQSCSGGFVTTDPFTFGGGPEAFDPEAHLAVIVNKCAPGAAPHATCRRKVEVRHGVHAWSIDPDSVLDVSMSNARLAGSWVLMGQLLPDEACGTPSAVGAQELALSVEMKCAEGGS
jgi:hypothetical protein